MNTTLPGVPAFRPAAKKQVKPLQKAVSHPVRFAGRYDDDGSTAPKKSSLISKIALAIGWPLGLFGTVAGVGMPMLMKSNPPGTASVAYLPYAGGTQDTVNLDGGVWAPFGTNYQYDTTQTGVKEFTRPRTQDGSEMDNVTINTTMQILPQSIRFLQQELSGKGQTNSATTSFEKNNPLTQQAYNVYVRPAVLSAVRDMSDVFRAEEYHVNIDLMNHWLNNGVRDFRYTSSDGTERTLNITSIKDQMRRFGINISQIGLVSLDLPNAMEAKFIERAQTSILRENARLEVRRNEAKALADTEQARITAIRDAELERGKQAAETLKRELGVQAAQLRARADEISARAKADVAAIDADAERQHNTIVSESQADAAKITAEAQAARDITISEGTATANLTLGQAEAERFRLSGEPLQNHPVLQREIALLQEKAALMGLAANQNLRINVIDPRTGVKIETFNFSGAEGAGINPGNVLGTAAALRAARPAQDAPAGR